MLYTRALPDWYAWMSYWEDEGRPPRRAKWSHDVDVDVDVDVGSGAPARGMRYGAKGKQGRRQLDWSEWSTGNEYWMDIFESLDDLKPHLAEELYSAVTQALKGDDVEFLDI